MSRFVFTDELAAAAVFGLSLHSIAGKKRRKKAQGMKTCDVCFREYAAAVKTCRSCKARVRSQRERDSSFMNQAEDRGLSPSRDRHSAGQRAKLAND